MSATVIAVFVTIFGAMVGSFLNACIYRMPRDLSLAEPRRSFCPACHRTIPWYENLPILSWLLLRGKCSGCHAPISFRYILVEILTAVAFYFAWKCFGLPLAPVYALLLALLIVATFIDIEHFIIPDTITIGGTVAGIVLSLGIPEIMSTSSRLQSLELSSLGALAGFGLLWLIVRLGKVAFGRKRHLIGKEEVFTWKPDGETFLLQIGEETLDWQEIFYRKKDELILEDVETTLNGKTLNGVTLRFREDRLIIDNETFPLAELEPFTGTMHAIIVPREAMGFGDVKFIAAIGAFLGWKAVLFAICVGSVIGCVAALAGILLARDKTGERVPFGPFLALGAVIWIFWGSMIWNWYFGAFLGGDTGLEF